jgi:hypothetical protein
MGSAGFSVPICQCFQLLAELSGQSDEEIQPLREKEKKILKIFYI